MTIRQKSHIKVAKKQKMSSHEATYPGKCVSRLGKNCIFRAKKWVSSPLTRYPSTVCFTTQQK